jgi:hypothetical protein
MLPANIGGRSASLPAPARYIAWHRFEGVDSMRTAIAASALLLAASVGGARADHQPSFVVPGKAGVPVIINGYDASWGVVEGDWGLYRAGHGPLTVIYAPQLTYPARERAYYPATGRKPRSGRHEVHTSAPLRAPQSFHRGWSTQSGSTEITNYPPLDPPPVIRAPRSETLPLDLK